MRLRTITEAWHRVFFVPQSPIPICLYRILFGLLVLADLILLRPDWLNWFGVHGWTTLATMHRMEPGNRLNLFDILPQSDQAINLFFWVALLSAFCLTVGFLTRLSSVLVWLTLVSIDERALYAMNAGDSVLRVAAFFLMFAPAGAALSVDRLLRIWRGKETSELKPRPVWPQRMIQFLAAWVYFSTAWVKSMGAAWVDGTAVYYVHHLEAFRRFPMPSWVDNPVLVKLQTWGGLAIEFALGTLIWIKEFRYWVLLAGVLLHLTLEYTMNVPLFQFVMLATFILFIDPADLDRVWAAVRKRVAGRQATPLKVVYDPAAQTAVRKVQTLRALDVFGLIETVEMGSSMPSLLVQTPQGPKAGFAAARELGRVVPLLWPLRLLGSDRRHPVNKPAPSPPEPATKRR